MNVLIVYTHPNHESLNYAFLQKTLEGIKANPKDTNVQVLDLYEEGFNPALVFNGDKRRRDMHSDPETSKYREQITWADHIVYIYPIWWGRPPAMLMGYVDRLFSTNFAYKNTNTAYGHVGLLKGKKVTCISTMKGPAGYITLFLNNAHKALMKKALFNYVGIKKVKFFEFGNSEVKNGNQAKQLNKVQKYFEALS